MKTRQPLVLDARHRHGEPLKRSLFASRIFHDFLSIANVLLNFALALLCESLSLLGDTADGFAGLLLHFSGNILDDTFDLILVHEISSMSS